MLADNFNLLGATEGAALNVAEAIVREELADRRARGEDYQKNLDMYLNKHEKYFTRRLDESDAVFKYRVDNAVKSNLCGFTVDLSAKYLYGKASKVVRRFSKSIDTQKSLTELTNDRISVQSFFLEQAKKCSIFSERLVRFIPVDYATGLQVSGTSTETTYPHPIGLDPRYTFVKRNRFNKICAVVIYYEQRDYTKATTTGVVELITEDSRWIWESANALMGSPLLYNSSNSSLPFFGMGTPKLVNGPVANAYGLCNEFVYFINNDDRKSDLIDISDLNIALDESLTDKQHFFQKHGWPQMVSEVDLSAVENSPNKIWEIQGDFPDNKKVTDRIGFITWDGKMEDHAKFAKNLERNIMILSNTAAISTGDLEAIGQLRSGAALITAHSVAIHKTEAKQIIWERSEKEFYKALINFDAYLHNQSPDTRYPDVSFEIRFPRDFVPGAEAERAQIQQIEINSHIKPVRDVIREIYGNIDDDEVEEKYNEIVEDSRTIVDSDRLFESKTDGVPTSSAQKSSEQKKSPKN